MSTFLITSNSVNIIAGYIDDARSAFGGAACEIRRNAPAMGAVRKFLNKIFNVFTTKITIRL
jgi:hypothetical protein